MHRLAIGASLAAVSALPISNASAHAIAGARVFPVTLTLDDPGVADEASLPTITYNRSGSNGGPGATHEYDLGFEYDKTITPSLGIGLNYGWNIVQTDNDKTRTGWQDLTVTLKDTVYINAPHEFILSLGLAREFGRTGTTHLGADTYGATTPIVYFGKGLNELPVDVLRPLAVTGELSYSIVDKSLKQIGPAPMAPSLAGVGTMAAQFNAGAANAWAGGLSFQYSIPYLQSQVRDLGLPPAFGNLVPLLEITWTSPATSPSNAAATYTFAPGVIYLADWYQVGIEALIPGNRASGTNVGVIAQFHLFLDDLLPNSLGRPIFE